MYRNNGMLAPHSNPFNLTFKVDGSDQNAGVYLAVEPIDKDFLKRNLAKSYRNGDLYKMGWTNVGATLDNIDSKLFGEETQVADGNRFKTDTRIDFHCIVKGDGLYESIAAASILAKSYRDDYMEKLHEEYPCYGWKSNKGYPTKKHYEAIAHNGITQYHRRSFSLDKQLTIQF
jgi:ribonuclease HII